jgi:hypothetical protein
MVEPDHRSAEQQAGERPHRQVGLGTARALLWVLIPLQLSMVRVAERCRGCFGCIEPVCAMREWARVALTSSRNSAARGSNPSLPDSTLAARFGPLRALKRVCRSWYSRMVSRRGNPAHSLVAGVAAGQRHFRTLAKIKAAFQIVLKRRPECRRFTGRPAAGPARPRRRRG